MITTFTTYFSCEVFWVRCWYYDPTFVTWDISHGTFISFFESSLSSAFKTFFGERKCIFIEKIEFLGNNFVILTTCFTFTDSL